MSAPEHHGTVRISKRARCVHPLFVHAVGLLGLAFFAACSPARPSPATTSSTTSTTAGGTTTTTAGVTTTTTAGVTTTTTGPTTTTTTTTTTTAAGSVDYATQVHPIWDSETCTNCHDSGHPVLNLVGTPVETCDALAARDAANEDLIIVGGGADNSLLLRKPQGAVSHAGGALPCFGNGAACYDTVLEWLTGGATGPGGTCGG